MGAFRRRYDLKQSARLKAGELKALVATASLELGIDIGSVDLVCQIGSARSIATFLQRVGRADHRRMGIAKGAAIPAQPRRVGRGRRRFAQHSRTETRRN